MNSVDFCYWLQGLFELSDPKTLDAHQTDLIKRHLNMVFFHEIDNKYPNKEKLLEIHNGAKPLPLSIPSGATGPQGPGTHIEKELSQTEIKVIGEPSSPRISEQKDETSNLQKDYTGQFKTLVDDILLGKKVHPIGRITHHTHSRDVIKC
jgi:hypothetical protein